MPKLRQTERQQREKALKLAIARARVELELSENTDMIDHLGLPPTTYYRKAKDPYAGFGFEDVGDFVRKMGFTGRELCAICGIPYGDRRDESCA